MIKLNHHNKDSKSQSLERKTRKRKVIKKVGGPVYRSNVKREKKQISKRKRKEFVNL